MGPSIELVDASLVHFDRRIEHIRVVLHLLGKAADVRRERVPLVSWQPGLESLWLEVWSEAPNFLCSDRVGSFGRVKDLYELLSGHDLLIVGGEDHRTGQENDGETRFANLKRWTEERFPNAGGIKYEWSGQFLETHDGLAFLGRFSDSEPNVYLITGDSGMGMTHGTVGAMIASDQILGRENVWANVYDPSRLTTQSLKEAVPEIIDSTVPYTDWVTPGDISSEADLKKGEGAVMRDGVSRIAVYRDENGEVHRLNAKCTHLGCVVRFNSLEKTWDCPCHGSRFALDGNPINSPAITPLSKAEN